MREVTEGKLPDIGIFPDRRIFDQGTADTRLCVTAWLVSQALNYSGPGRNAQIIKETLEAAGEKYRLRKVGAAGLRATMASGWMPLAVPSARPFLAGISRRRF